MTDGTGGRPGEAGHMGFARASPSDPVIRSSSVEVRVHGGGHMETLAVVFCPAVTETVTETFLYPFRENVSV